MKEALEIHRITAVENLYVLVFCNKEGKPIDGKNMTARDFHPTLRLAGLRKIRFHDLRHTFTTLLINQNENIKFIQSQLGHASIQTTIDRYGHLLPCDQHGVGVKLDGQIFSPESIQDSEIDLQGNYLKVKEEQSSTIIS